MAPLVSVIIATYNWSSVLHYAIESALSQTIRNIEVLLMGDGCDDDSEAVAAAFRDPRVQWQNLPENSGGQSAPNNAGLAKAKGEFVAYLGHHDLWLPRHLERLVEAVERERADIAYSLCAMIGPPGTGIRVLSGVSPSGQYEHNTLVPPSSLLHRRDMFPDPAPWRDYRSLQVPADAAFVASAWSAGKRFVAVRELTVFKFPAPWRKDCYIERPCHEQAEYLRRMRTELDFVEVETLAIALAYAEGKATCPVHYPLPPPDAPGGWHVDQWRAYKGLPRAPGERTSQPPFRDPVALRRWNRRGDIVPAEHVEALYASDRLPSDGILLGRGWHELEAQSAEVFRWADNDCEIVITNIDAAPLQLILDAEAGPALKCEPFELLLLDSQGRRVSSAIVSYRHAITLDLPAIEAEGAVVRLTAPSGGSAIPPDTRKLNFRVFRIGRARGCSGVRGRDPTYSPPIPRIPLK